MLSLRILTLGENTQTVSGKGSLGKELWPFAITNVSDPLKEWKPPGQLSLQMTVALADVLTATS